MSYFDEEIKRNTKLKHKRNHIDEEYPDFRNITELKKTLNIKNQDVNQAYESIAEWFDQHPENRPDNVRTAIARTQIRPLLEYLCEKFEFWFDESHGSGLRLAAWNVLIRRYLSNGRRKKDTDQTKSVKTLKTSTPNLKTDSSPQSYPMSSPSGQNQLSTVVNDTITKALFKVRCNRLVTLIEVTSVLEENNRQHDGSSVIRRISFEKLCHFLRTDFEIDSTFDISYVSDGKRMAVREDRHLQSLVLDLSNTGDNKINLIVELSDAQKVRTSFGLS